ncbi:hypothetical protein OSTOST_01444, partial [Ostertagia ostertagi]
PCSSFRGARLNCVDVAQSLRTFFPENYETLAKHLFDLLSSERTNEELQGELIDLVGFDHFEMVGGILESRSQLINELNASRHEATKLSSYAPEKDKTKLLHIGSQNPAFSYSIGGSPITPVAKVKDLGFLITSDLCFDQHCEFVVNRGYNATYRLFKALFGSRKILSSTAKLNCRFHFFSMRANLLYTAMSKKTAIPVSIHSFRRIIDKYLDP